MKSLARWLGIFASMAWLLLTSVTAASSLLRSGALAINLIMATVFGSVALVTWLRVRAVGALQSTAQSHDALRNLLRVEIVTSLGLALVGLALLIAATFRVMIEGMPVFG